MIAHRIQLTGRQELHESDKGGAPGQWSARKAQMMAKEYKDRGTLREILHKPGNSINVRVSYVGGEYNTDPSEKDESQKNLQQWGEEEWYVAPAS